MEINDLNLIGVSVAPNKADPPLTADANAVLPFSVTLEYFQMVPRNMTEIAQRNGRV